MDHVLSSPPPSVAGATPLTTHEAKEPPTKDVREDVIHPRATATSFPQPLFSIAVVQFFLFRVGQHVVGKADFFELCWITTGTTLCQNTETS